MGIIFKSPEMQDHEWVLWRKFANRTQGNRAVGGRLHLTDRQLIYEPNRFDAVTKGRPWSATLASIQAVSTEGRNGSLFSGGMRTRLRIELETGSTEYFVVNRAQDVVKVIKGAV